MIKKFSRIDSVAVFQNFIWNASLNDFKKINLLYGRNYSGKTTLSRLIRALETGELPKKWNIPDFVIEWNNGCQSLPNDLLGHSEVIRVFNEDFVRDNLSFLSDTSRDDGEIAPFAVLGAENLQIETQLRILQDALGSRKAEQETGLYRKLRENRESLAQITKQRAQKAKELEGLLKSVATEGKTSIRNQPNVYGDQNYHIGKLKNDLDDVLSDDYTAITEQEKRNYEARLSETPKDALTEHEVETLCPDFKEINAKVEEIVETRISDANKILELLENSELNSWVEQGLKLHQRKKRCAFCGAEITETRLIKLLAHFDDASEKLKNNIRAWLDKLTRIKMELLAFDGFNKNLFYREFQTEVAELETSYIERRDKFIEQIDVLCETLKKRQENIAAPITFKSPDNYRDGVVKVLKDLNSVIRRSNQYGKELNARQNEAKKALLYRRVWELATQSSYSYLDDELKKLTEQQKQVEAAQETLLEEIETKEREIERLKRSLNDETRGAALVNEYLQKVSGLFLQAVEHLDSNERAIRFEVRRDSEKAYNLSEGECSLIAFCYFLAKLRDVETTSVQPIVWIDDPISSLDNNHIFFIYSLIASEIVANERCKQLFISTHNLEFLKYLHQLGKTNKYLVERIGNSSSIRTLPQYMTQHTEFIYLFKQIYICAKNTPNDNNYESFYNFGNNARKFIEIYLFYWRPNYSNKEKTTLLVEELFGNLVASYWGQSVWNERSHIRNFESGLSAPIYAEIPQVAELILQGIKDKHPEQYAALEAAIKGNI